ncbi:MAG: hypothetical protein GY861_25950 [bacterium]|nr:hypothetical protein [bacterium]
MKFKRELLQRLVWEDYDEEKEDIENISEEIIDTSRWSNHYEMIFRYSDKFYRSHFSRGATESQDEQPYEYEPDEIECSEVKQVEKTVKVWEVV